FSSPSDPSSVDAAAGFHYSFARTSAGLASTYSTATTANSSPFFFTDNGTYTVYGRIFDKDSGYTDYATIVTVRNVAPVVSGTATQYASRGSATPFSLGGFTDPG